VQVQRSTKHRMPAHGAQAEIFWDGDDVTVLPLD
jgi:hypothetical protein